MFETAELKQTIGKKEYNEEVPRLRTELLEIQQELRKAEIPVIVVFSGVDAGARRSGRFDMSCDLRDDDGDGDGD